MPDQNPPSAQGDQWVGSGYRAVESRQQAFDEGYFYLGKPSDFGLRPEERSVMNTRRGFFESIDRTKPITQVDEVVRARVG